VGPRAGVDDVDPTGTRNSDPSIVQPVASRYSDYAIPAPSVLLMVLWQIPGNMVPLLCNDQGKHCYVRGNEYAPLLESREPLAEQRIDAATHNLVTDSNVSYATQQRMNCCIVATTSRESY
jgi:hypothetical protein